MRFPLALDLGRGVPLLGHERPPAAPQRAPVWQPHQQAQAQLQQQAQQQPEDSAAAPALALYQLRAVIVHHGPLAGAGHYTVFRRLDGSSSGDSGSGGGSSSSNGSSGGGGSCSSDSRGSLAAGAGSGCWVRASDEAVHPASVDEVLAAEAALLVYEQPPG